MIWDEWQAVLWWALPNLVVPLVAIPIVIGIHWMSSRPISWTAIIADGQVCFYSIAILASAWYDLREVSFRPPTGRSVSALEKALELQKSIGWVNGWIFFVGALAALAYGIVASDHSGAKILNRDRCAAVSIAIGVASVWVAVQVHAIVAAS